MRLKYYLIIFVIVGFSFTLIISLALLQHSSKNGFNRVIKKVGLTQIKSIDLKTSDIYFAGLSPGKIYLKTIGNKKQLFSINYSLDKLTKLDLKLTQKLSIGNKKMNIGVQDSTIYITNRIGDISIISNHKKLKLKNSRITFDQSFLISDQALVVRQTLLKDSQLRRKLTKYNYLNDGIENSYLLAKQIDGYFCTDGLLSFDKNNSRIYYMYFYRGEFLCLDTNLKLLYGGKTIDTVAFAKMEISETKKNGTSITQSSPPRLVNRNAAFYKDRLYVLSALMADNEQSVDFRQNQIVDVYKVRDGKYKYSFYIPKYRGIKVRELRIENELVFVIYDKFLVKYAINLEETGL